MKLYRGHGCEKSWSVPVTLFDLRFGDPRCAARGRGTTRRSRSRHEAREGRDGCADTKGGRLGCPRRGSTLLNCRGHPRCRITRSRRRVIGHRDDLVALGLLGTACGGGDLISFPLPRGVLLGDDWWHLGHGRMAYLLDSSPTK